MKWKNKNDDNDKKKQITNCSNNKEDNDKNIGTKEIGNNTTTK